MSTPNTLKTAIVTGSSRGIGRAIALRLAQEGYAVVVNYAGRVEEADRVVAEIHGQSGQAIAVQADVSKKDDCIRLFAEAEHAFGQVDVLVNSAGVFHLATIAAASDEDYHQTFNINVLGTLNTMQQAALRLRDFGRIINFSTSAIAIARPGYGLYIASKAAVEQLTRVMASELRGRNITVNAIAPGPVATEMFLSGKSDELIQEFAKMPPLERLGEPEDIAGVVAFLAGADGAWINGQVLRANGGLA
ncbi:SDR family oxidoreductase [Aquirhabdus sp.]|uniref:SDR family oxidoreductase n=1 Tax=Aquirhabdus sp. TaxID=2824160 RepID=UPI00396C98D3